MFKKYKRSTSFDDQPSDVRMSTYSTAWVQVTNPRAECLVSALRSAVLQECLVACLHKWN